MSLWSYRDDITDSSADIVGYDVQALDGGIGKIDETSVDAGAAYVVIDTGFWIFGKKRLVPAAAVERIDPEERTAYVRLTKDQVKSAPDFDESHRDERPEEYENYYQPYGW